MVPRPRRVDNWSASAIELWVFPGFRIWIWQYFSRKCSDVSAGVLTGLFSGSGVGWGPLWSGVDYYFSLRGVEGLEKRAEVIRECHERGAQRLLALCFANGGIYVKLGQHVGQLVGCCSTLQRIQWNGEEFASLRLVFLWWTGPLVAADICWNDEEQSVGSVPCYALWNSQAHHWSKPGEICGRAVQSHWDYTSCKRVSGSGDVDHHCTKQRNRNSLVAELKGAQVMQMLE